MFLLVIGDCIDDDDEIVGVDFFTERDGIYVERGKLFDRNGVNLRIGVLMSFFSNL